MTSISSATSLSSSQRPNLRALMSSGSPQGGPAAMREQMNRALEQQGLSSDQRAAIETDLQDLMGNMLQSGSFPPDPAQMQSQVKGVLEKHGVNVEQLMEGRGMPAGMGAGMAGGMSGQSVSSAYSESDPTSTLLDLLKKWSADVGQSGSDSDTQGWTQDLLSQLTGIDAAA